MALGHRIRPFRTLAAPAVAHGRRPVRARGVLHQDGGQVALGVLQLLRLDGYDVPPIIAALVSTEDVRYRGHSGIDLMSLVRVGVKTVLMQNTSQGGGSTITQQLAKNLFPRDINENRGKIARTTKLVVSKLKEWITALKLEYNYTKEEIAAMYLNTVEFGSNAYGIKSAAHTTRSPR